MNNVPFPRLTPALKSATRRTLSFRKKQADLNFIKAAREAAALVNSAMLQTELNRAAGAHYTPE